jgi:hypothetical protein
VKQDKKKDKDLHKKHKINMPFKDALQQALNTPIPKKEKKDKDKKKR